MWSVNQKRWLITVSSNLIYSTPYAEDFPSRKYIRRERLAPFRVITQDVPFFSWSIDKNAETLGYTCWLFPPPVFCTVVVLCSKKSVNPRFQKDKAINRRKRTKVLTNYPLDISIRYFWNTRVAGSGSSSRNGIAESGSFQQVQLKDIVSVVQHRFKFW